MTRRRPALLATVLFLLLPPLIRAQSANEMVAALEQKYDSLKSFSASFEQRFENGEQALDESGRLVIRKPGKMYWEYSQPATKYFVVNGKRSWFYVPRDKQVVVTDLEGETSTPLLLLFGQANLAQDFIVEEETETPPTVQGDWMLRLTPRVPEGEYAYILLEVDPASRLISRLTVVDPIGGRNRYSFSDFREDVKAPDQLFKLKLPSDVEIIRQ
jgi:outer membrane lipoprotein carrier protein